MPRTAVYKTSINFYNEDFATLVKEEAKKHRIHVGQLAKQALAKMLYVELPEEDKYVFRPAIGKYAHIVGTNETRAKNIKNLTQYILDHWDEMPTDIKAQVITNTIEANKASD